MKKIKRKSVGIDIVEVKRFKKFLEKENENLRNKIFTSKEIEYALSRPIPEETFAGIYSLKESFIKANEWSILEKNILTEIEILHKKNGAPYVSYLGKMQKKAKVSISHSKDFAISECILF